MRACTVYTCEFCGYECRGYDEMMTHEADHLGITIDELNTYIRLKRSLRWHRRCATEPIKDPDYKDKYLARGKENLLKTREKIANFEKEHNINPNNPMEEFHIDRTGLYISDK